MNARHNSIEVATATQIVEELDDRASSLRRELVRLQQTLTTLGVELAKPRATELLLANEQLVLAALHADQIAETAVGKLDELVRTSQRDALTGTPNRTLMLDRINAAIALARRHRARCALLFIDVDKFKHINDEFGHEVGDEVIMLVASRLRTLVRQSDTVGRHGGDEFLVLLAEAQRPADVAIVAVKMLAKLSEPFTINGNTLMFTVSIGIAMWPEDGDDAATLISRADTAMYHSKRNGHGSFEFHSSEIATARANASADTATMRALTHETARPVDTLPRLRELCEANEKLALGALAAQEQQLSAKNVHLRQIRYIAMVAHELRSPLAPLGTATELLHHATSDEPLLVRLQAIIKRQVAHMSRLVQDLLDGSRATTGTFRLERLPVDMNTIIAHAIEASSALMTSRRQSFTAQVVPGNFVVLGDAMRLTQVFSNLLDNASKYTPAAGSITLTASVDEQWLRVIIGDDGIGISSAALSSIFELFVQEEHAISVNKTGLGIGLAVVRDLVKGHGGEVSCLSAGRGLGSQFTVLLPLIAASVEK
jgi:diguanylate cyclase (GGDEF)-like protein